MEDGSPTCRRCGSSKVATDLFAETGTFDGLRVTAARRPDRAVFAGKVTTSVRASVCGDCGHVELTADKAAGLYAAWLEGRARTS